VYQCILYLLAIRFEYRNFTQRQTIDLRRLFEGAEQLKGRRMTVQQIMQGGVAANRFREQKALAKVGILRKVTPNMGDNPQWRATGFRVQGLIGDHLQRSLKELLSFVAQKIDFYAVAACNLG
jgi:hypothetical protein